MNKVFSIASLTIRSAFRSRVFISTLVLLMLVIVGLPLTVHGDGTLPGYVQILLNYTLGLATILLAIETVWLACAAFSVEIREKELQLVVTKPVHTYQVWLGKWLGLLALNTVLLAVAGIVTYALLRGTTRAEMLSEEEQRVLREEILVARRQVLPAPPELEEQARATYEQRLKAGDLPPNMTAETALETIRETLEIRANSIPSGYKRRWTFSLPPRLHPDQPIILQYKLSSSRGADQPVRGTWFSGPGQDPERLRNTAVSTPGGVYKVPIPPSVLGDERDLIVTYANVNPVPTTVLFTGKEDIQLLVYEGTFERNFLRALLVILIQLAFLAAVGLAAGSLLSMPVAAFASGWFILVLGLGDYLKRMAGTRIFFGGHGGAAHGPGFWDYFFRSVFRIMSAIVEPLQSPNTLELLTVGRLVSWPLVLSSFLVKIVFYSGVLVIVSSWILNRREIALLT